MPSFDVILALPTVLLMFLEWVVPQLLLLLFLCFTWKHEGEDMSTCLSACFISETAKFLYCGVGSVWSYSWSILVNIISLLSWSSNQTLNFSKFTDYTRSCTCHKILISLTLTALFEAVCDIMSMTAKCGAPSRLFLAVLTEVFHCFPQFFQTDAGLIPQATIASFKILSDSTFICHWMYRCCGWISVCEELYRTISTISFVVSRPLDVIYVLQN